MTRTQQSWASGEDATVSHRRALSASGYNHCMRLIGRFSILGLLMLSLAAFGQNPSKKIDTEELSRLLEKSENIFFLDVREPEEIQRLGSVKGYVNIPLGQLEKRLAEIPKNKVIVTL